VSNPETKVGVGQLAFTFSLPQEDAKDDAQETQDNGSQESRTALSSASKPERKRKWHSLYDKVDALPNLEQAWKQVAENNGAAGIDKVTVEQFSENASARLQQLNLDLRQKTYRPVSVRRVFIPKGAGGKRLLGIPTIRDRIVQQALRQVLEPIFEGVFSSRSHGFRPGRGSPTALDVVERAIRSGYTWVVDADIASFFDTVDHEKLLDAVNEEVADGSVLRLIRYILKSGVKLAQVSESEPTEQGTPQGGPVSPLLANIYLHAFDTAIAQRGYGLVRYADDFVIFTKSEGEAQAALAACREVLEGRLGLVVHPEKTRIVSVDAGFEFLGFHYFRDPKSGVRCKEVRPKSVRCFRDAVRKRTPRLRTQRPVKPRHVTFARLAKNQRVANMIRGLNGFVRGWHWYFKSIVGRYKEPFESFDTFVRRRVRSAITGRSAGRGWWNQALPNATLRQLGPQWPSDLQIRYAQGHLAAPARKGQLVESRMREIRTYGSGRKEAG
jgi:RNA-directed DNA polymerase